MVEVGLDLAEAQTQPLPGWWQELQGLGFVAYLLKTRFKVKRPIAFRAAGNGHQVGVEFIPNCASCYRVTFQTIGEMTKIRARVNNCHS